jgi:DNA-binding transcriptional LysR family regulator
MSAGRCTIAMTGVFSVFTCPLRPLPDGGSPEYFQKHGVPLVPSDLLQHRCIRVRLPDGSLFRWRSEKDGEQVPIDVRGPITLDEASLTRTSILEGTGIGYIFEQDILSELEAGRVIRVLADWTPPYPGLCLYYPGRRNLSAGVRAFLELARELSRRDDG